jgi:hypothetical protein
MIKSGCTLKIIRDSDGKFESKTCIDFPKGWNKLTASCNLDKPNWLGINGSGGVFVLDVDGKDASKNGFISLIERDIDVDSFNTRTYSTPSGIGRHFYFTMEDRLKPLLKTINIIDGVDIPEGVFGGAGYELTLDVDPIYMEDDLFNMLINSKNDRAVTKVTKTKTIETVECDDSITEAIRALVNIIPIPAIKPRDQWYGMGCAIKHFLNGQTGFTVWIELSMRDKDGYKRTNLKEMQCSWDAMTSDSDLMTINALTKYIKGKRGSRDWLEKYMHLFEKKIEIESDIDTSTCLYTGRFDSEDPYNWNTLESEIFNAKYKSIVDAQYAIMDKLHRCCVKIGNSLLFKDTELNRFESFNKGTQSHLYIKYYGIDKNDNQVLLKLSFFKFLIDYAYVIPQYLDTSPMYLNHKNAEDLLSRKVFYTAQPFQAIYRADYDVNMLDGLLWYIKELLCTSDDIVYDYMIKWLSFIMNNPNCKSGICVMLTGKQGNGKSTLADFLAKKIFGMNNSLSNVSGLAQLLVDKNEHLDNKKFICINETSSTKDSYNGDSDKLKTLITEEVMTIRGMYKAPRVTKSYAEYMITTNHAMSVKIESNDRRYLQLEVSSAKMNDKAYWVDLYENHLTQEVADVFYSWLMDMNVGMEFKQIPLPMTDLKRSIISVKMCSVESYVRYLLETYSDTLDANYESNEFIKSDDHRMVAKCSIQNKSMSKSEVYRSYEIYCQEGNERVAKSKELHRQLSDLTNIIEHKSHGTRGYKLADFKLT